VTASHPVIMDRVTKCYRGGRGIEQVDLEVRKGEVFAFLGPNGAGKTTTIRVLLDLIRPDAGSVFLFGMALRPHSVDLRRRIGYLPGELALYEHLTARELLTHFAHLRGGPPWAAIAAMADAFDLDLAKPIRALSKGNRQKVGLVQAMMGDPDLLVLDEPTSGLDPLVQDQVHHLIRSAAHEGHTVFLSSHVLSEVGQVADRVGIIQEGRMVGIQRVAELRHESVRYVEVRFAGGFVPAELDALTGVSMLPPTGGNLRFAVKGDLDPVIALLASNHVEELAVREPDLEDALFDLVSGKSRAGAEEADRVGS
jgi:ABC-2 type transport system ATP-binding protein